MKLYTKGSSHSSRNLNFACESMPTEPILGITEIESKLRSSNDSTSTYQSGSKGFNLGIRVSNRKKKKGREKWENFREETKEREREAESCKEEMRE